MSSILQQVVPRLATEAIDEKADPADIANPVIASSEFAYKVRI
jgi:hypothetical protein